MAVALTAVCAGADDETNPAPAVLDTKDPAVVLPGFEVTDCRPWRYAAIPGVRVLSQAGRDDTEAFVQQLVAEQVFLDGLVPGIGREAGGRPGITIVLDSSAVSENVRKLGAGNQKGHFAWIKSAGDSVIRVCSVYEVQGGSGRSAEQTVEYVREFMSEYRIALLHRHRELPEWYRQGLLGAVVGRPSGGNERTRGDYFLLYKVGVYSLEATGLEKPEGGVAERYMTFDRFFAVAYPDVSVLEPRSVLWKDQCLLFLHWGLLGGGAEQRKAFQRFAAAASRGPVDEALFRRYFGFGYEEGQRRFLKFARAAIKGGKRNGGAVWIGGPRTSRVKSARSSANGRPVHGEVVVRAATRTEVVEVLGEVYLWAGLKQTDRLWVGGPVNMDQPRFGHVYSGLMGPAEFLPFLKKDREALRGMAFGSESSRFFFDKAKDMMYRCHREEGAGDPELAAALGLVESLGGDAGRAAVLLQEAVDARVTRAIVYSELAHLRLCEALKEPKGPDGRPSRSQIEPVRSLLAEALRLDPQMGSAYQLLAFAWGCSGGVPPEGDLDLIRRSARLFPERTPSMLEAAALFERSGDQAEAACLARIALAWRERQEKRFGPDKSKKARAMMEELRRMAGEATP